MQLDGDVLAPNDTLNITANVFGMTDGSEIDRVLLSVDWEDPM